MDGEIIDTMDKIYKDFVGRRNGLRIALTDHLDSLKRQCDPAEELEDDLCLYGFPTNSWCLFPPEAVPTDHPIPLLGVTFDRANMNDEDWLLWVAHRSDAWLVALAYTFAARAGFDQAGREELFLMINQVPTLTGVIKKAQAKKQSYEKASEEKASTSSSGSELKRESEGGNEPQAKSLKLEDKVGEGSGDTQSGAREEDAGLKDNLDEQNKDAPSGSCGQQSCPEI